jgi:hypothetical protein
MSYADRLGLLKTISQYKYIDAVRDGIDSLGVEMERAGYDPADIRRYFRLVLLKLAGMRFADYCWDFFVFSRAKMLFRYAEAEYDRKYPNSFGLLWTITFEQGEGIDRCQFAVEHLDRFATTEEQLEKARRKEEEVRQKFIRERGGLTILVEKPY